MSDSPATVSTKVLIVGGGAAGITVANLLRKQRPSLQITILEPSSDHFYQPGWTLVGGGLMPVERTRRNEADLIPKGVTWIQAAAGTFDPDQNVVITAAGQRIQYEAMVLATGLECREPKATAGHS